MQSSSSRTERKLSVHLTRLTVEDIHRIRCQLKRKVEDEPNKDPKSKTIRKKSSSSHSHKANAPSANSTSILANEDLSLKNDSKKTTRAKAKKNSTFSSSKRSRKRKRASNILFSKPDPKNVFIGPRASTWNDNGSYSTSEESELEEIFVPQKIWIKPSARPLSPKLSKSDTAAETQTPEIQNETEHNFVSRFPARRPVIRLKKMSDVAGIKHESCDETIPTRYKLRARNSSNTNENLLHDEAASQSFENDYKPDLKKETASCDDQSFANDVKPQILMKEVTSCDLARKTARMVTRSSSKVAKKLPHSKAVSQSSENDEKPPILEQKAASCDLASQTTSTIISEISTNSPSRCSCQLSVAPTVTTAVQTNPPEVSTRSNLLTNEPTRASQQKTVSVRDIGVVEKNQSDDAICSPVIFDEESPATQDFDGEASSPIIFGSNEGTAAEIGDAFGSKNSVQDPPSDSCNSSSSFILELTADELYEREASSKNGNLTADSSQNFNLQLSENLTHENVQGRVNSQEFSPRMPGKDSSNSCNSQLSSSGEKMLSSRTLPNRSSDEEAPSNLSGLETLNISESNNSCSFGEYLDFPETMNVHISPLNDKSHMTSSETWSSAVKPPNFLVNQKVYSVKSLSPKQRPRISVLKKVQNIFGGDKSNVDPSNNQKNPSSVDMPAMSDMSKTKKKVSVVVQPPSFAEFGKNCHAFTQTDPQVVHQQPSQLSVNYIINSSSLNTIRFEGPVLNHPSAMAGISEQVPTSDSTFVPETHHCSRLQTNRNPCECNTRNFFRCNEIPNSPSSDSRLKKTSITPARKTPEELCSNNHIMIDSIDLTGDDEPKCGGRPLGKIRLKTPSELGCTIAFTDDIERLSRQELPKLQCNLDQLELLKNKHFYVFKLVLAKVFKGKTVTDALQELCSTRSVPCGFNLMRLSLHSVQRPAS